MQELRHRLNERRYLIVSPISAWWLCLKMIEWCTRRFLSPFERLWRVQCFYSLQLVCEETTTVSMLRPVNVTLEIVIVGSFMQNVDIDVVETSGNGFEPNLYLPILLDGAGTLWKHGSRFKDQIRMIFDSCSTLLEGEQCKANEYNRPVWRRHENGWLSTGLITSEQCVPGHQWDARVMCSETLSLSLSSSSSWCNRFSSTARKRYKLSGPWSKVCFVLLFGCIVMLCL